MTPKGVGYWLRVADRWFSIAMLQAEMGISPKVALAAYDATVKEICGI